MIFYYFIFRVVADLTNVIRAVDCFEDGGATFKQCAM